MKESGVFLLVLTLLLSCGGGEPQADASQTHQTYLIGLAICMTPETPFFVSMLAGAQEAAASLDSEIIAVYADENPELQSRQMLDLAEQGIDVLLLNPVSDSVIPSMERIISMGIPVITIDRGVNSDAVACHIASDNRAGGRMAGEYLAESLHRSGRIVEIMGTRGSSAAIERGEGFRQSISMYPDIEIISSFHADFSRSEAREQFLLLLGEDTEIDGVFAHNDDMILGAISAAEEYGSEEMLFVGFDAIEEAVTMIENGKLLATVAQKPMEMGRLGVETAVDLLSGKEIPDSIIVDLALILQ